MSIWGHQITAFYATITAFWQLANLLRWMLKAVLLQTVNRDSASECKVVHASRVLQQKEWRSLSWVRVWEKYKHSSYKNIMIKAVHFISSTRKSFQSEIIVLSNSHIFFCYRNLSPQLMQSMDSQNDGQLFHWLEVSFGNWRKFKTLPSWRK